MSKSGKFLPPQLSSFSVSTRVLIVLENGKAQVIQSQTIENQPSKASIQNCFTGTYPSYESLCPLSRRDVYITPTI